MYYSHPSLIDVLYGKKQLGHSDLNNVLFQKKRGWVNDDRIITFEWNIPLRMNQTWKTSLNVPITVITTISLSLCCSCCPGYRTFPNICLFFLCYFRCVEAVWEWLIADEWVRRETHTLIVILSPLCVCVCLTCVYEREKVLDCVRLGGLVFMLLIFRKSRHTHTYTLVYLISRDHLHTSLDIQKPKWAFHQSQGHAELYELQNLCVFICVGTLHVCNIPREKAEVMI